MIKTLVAATSLALALLAGCGGGDTSGAPGSGGSDEGGGSPSASSVGGGGGASACQLDCSTIKTPQCQAAVCDDKTAQCTVVAADEDSECDDAQFCTKGEKCKAGSCVGGGQNDCDMPGDACTAIVCDEQTKSCSTAPLNDGVPCSPTDLCQVNAVCKGSLCVGTPKDCFFAPTGECNTAVCNPATGKCDGTPDMAKNGLACYQSGDLCMVQKTCSNGDCVGGVAKNCSIFTNGCNNGLCDPVDGQCYAEAIAEGDMCLEATDACNTGICDNMGNCNPVPANDAGPCEDGNSCTMGDTCLGGACQSGSTAGYVQYFTETFANNDAGWTLGTEWQIGPAMASSCGQSNDDPAMDHTPDADNGVAGVIIGGCATISVHPFYYLTSPVIDTSIAPASVYLEFWRFLNSDFAPYQDDTVEVFNGTMWVVVWQQGTVTTSDTMWTHVSYDITAHKNAAMQIRIGHNVNSTGLVYVESQWNVDDVVVANAVCN